MKFLMVFSAGQQNIHNHIPFKDTLIIISHVLHGIVVDFWRQLEIAFNAPIQSRSCPNIYPSSKKFILILGCNKKGDEETMREG